MSELKPCPFCGGEAYIWPVPGNGQRVALKVSCIKDCLTMPARSDTFFTSKEEATKYWNTRADTAEKKLEEIEHKVKLEMLHWDWQARKDNREGWEIARDYSESFGLEAEVILDIIRRIKEGGEPNV